MVGYSADLGVEAPRIYIDCKKVLSKLDNTEIDEKVNAKREELARMRKRAPLDEMRQAIVQEVSVALFNLDQVASASKNGVNSVICAAVGRKPIKIPRRRKSDYLQVGDYKRYNSTAWKSNAQLQLEARREGISVKSILSTESGKSTGCTS